MSLKRSFRKHDDSLHGERRSWQFSAIGLCRFSGRDTEPRIYVRLAGSNRHQVRGHVAHLPEWLASFVRLTAPNGFAGVVPPLTLKQECRIFFSKQEFHAKTQRSKDAKSNRYCSLL